MEFNNIKSLVYEEYIKNGYLTAWTVPQTYQLLADLSEASLIHTEVTELQEALWGGDNKGKLGNECADIIIRVMNLCSRLGIDLEDAMLKKNIINLGRGKLHGKRGR